MIQHLHNTYLQIEKFVYENGINVSLFNAEKSTRYQNFQKSLQKALLSQIKAVANKETLPLLISLAKIKGTTAELLAQVTVLVNKNKLSNSVELAIYLIWAADQGGQSALDKMGIDAVFGLKDERLIAYFEDYSNLILDSVDDYTKQWVASKIQEGKDKGLSPFQIQQLLTEDGSMISKIRAERIVLTETNKAMSTIELETARRNGIEDKIWRTSLDERVCPICAPLEGEQQAINGDFSVGVASPPAHVSCRCFIEEVIPDTWVMPDNIWVGE